MEKSISFRAHLYSNTTDLIKGVDIQCARTAALVTELVSLLAAYTEEGVPLSPTIFICDSVASLLQRAGVGEHLLLSINENTDTAASKILKQAAPLCNDNWRVFIERSPDGKTCNFGVFCGSSDPSSLTVDEIVLSEYEAGFPVIRITQNSTNKVEVRTNAGGSVEFRFNNDEDEIKLETGAKISALAQSIAGSFDDQAFTDFVDRILSTALKRCHGALVAVLPDLTSNLPLTLSDNVILEPSLDLHERFQSHLDSGKTAASVSRLQTASELVEGLIRSDGITVFNRTGVLICYRAFVNSDSTEPTPTGGARTRAFKTLCGLVSRGELDTAFFRSQDGRVEIQKHNKVDAK